MAKVTLEIIRRGAIVLSTCQSHVDALLGCCKKTGIDYLKAWEIVAERLPEQILITARSISEVLGFFMERKRKLNISRHLRDRILAVDRYLLTFGIDRQRLIDVLAVTNIQDINDVVNLGVSI